MYNLEMSKNVELFGSMFNHISKINNNKSDSANVVNDGHNTIVNNSSVNDILHKIDLAFSEDIYFPESLLSGWLNVSGVILTTSLVFYHMSRVKSIKVEPYLAKIIAIGLIIVSTGYMMYALIPYFKRMNYNIDKCVRLKECSDEQATELKILKWSYIILGIITLAIQCGITYLVISTI